MKKITIRGKGKPVSFKKGALHAELGVPQGEKIPAAKMAAAASGKDGPVAQKRANFAEGMLAAGRKTAAKGKKKGTAAENKARIVRAAKKASK